MFDRPGSILRTILAIAGFLSALTSSFANAQLRAAILVPDPIYSERIATYDVVVFCRLVDGPQAKPLGDGSYLYEVTEILKGSDSLKKQPAATTPFRFEAFPPSGKPDDSVYFAGAFKEDNSLVWDLVTKVNDRRREYLRILAKPLAGDGTRAASLIPFLEAPEKEFPESFSLDLDLELLAIPYHEIRRARAALPLARIRNWINDPKTVDDRYLVCLRLLGACGTKDDLPSVKSVVFGKEKRHRDALSESTACYLRLGGEAVLTEIEAAYLRPAPGKRIDYWQFHIALVGVCEVVRDSEMISRERQLALFRPILDQPVLSIGIVVLELARLEDWDSTARMIELSRTLPMDSTESSSRGAVAHFLRRSPRPEAKARLEELKRLDPQAVRLYENEETP